MANMPTHAHFATVTRVAFVFGFLVSACGGGAGFTASAPAPEPTPGLLPSPLASPDAGTGIWTCLPGAPCPSTGNPAPSPPASQAASAAEVNPEGYRTITPDAKDVATVQLEPRFSFHRLDSEGPLVVLDESLCYWASRSVTLTACRSIVLVDLEAETYGILDKAPEGWIAWMPAISDRRVVWLELHSQGPDNTGALDWRIQMTTLDHRDTETLVSGVQQRSEPTSSTAWPALDIDGDQLAYAIEDPSSPPTGWKIVVISLTNGAVERVIPTDLPVYDLAVDGSYVAYTEGHIDPDAGFTYDTRLMVADVGDAVPREIAKDTFEVDMDDGRVAWSQDSPKGVIGAAQGTRIWTAMAPEFDPEPASPVPQQGDEHHQAWPTTGDGLVTWDSYRFSETDVSVNGDRVGVWNPASRRAYEVDVDRGGVLSSVGGGWLVWVNDYYTDEGPPVSGIRITDVGLR